MVLIKVTVESTTTTDPKEEEEETAMATKTEDKVEAKSTESKFLTSSMTELACLNPYSLMFYRAHHTHAHTVVKKLCFDLISLCYSEKYVTLCTLFNVLFI